MTRYELIQTQLLQQPKRWLVTGVSGFIGSNLLEALLALNQRVVGLDNFATLWRFSTSMKCKPSLLKGNGTTLSFCKATYAT